MRCIKHTSEEGILLDGGFLPYHTRNKTGYGVDDHHGRQFSPRKDIIPYGDLQVHVLVNAPFGHSFVPAADDNEVLFRRPGFRKMLSQDHALGARMHHKGLTCGFFFILSC